MKTFLSDLQQQPTTTTPTTATTPHSMTDQPAPTKKPRVNRVRLNTFITPTTHATVKRLNREGVGRSDGAVIDLAVSDLADKVAKGGSE